MTTAHRPECSQDDDDQDEELLLVKKAAAGLVQKRRKVAIKTQVKAIDVSLPLCRG
jgi:hypothetical protein